MKRKSNRNKTPNTFELEFSKQPRLYQISNSLLTSAEAVVGARARKMWSGGCKSHMLPGVPNSQPSCCEDEAPELELCKLLSTFTPAQLSRRMVPESWSHPGLEAVVCIPPVTIPSD